MGTEGLPADTTITSPLTNAHRVSLVKSTSSIGSEMFLIYAGGKYSDWIIGIFATAQHSIIRAAKLKCQPETLNMSQSHPVWSNSAHCTIINHASWAECMWHHLIPEQHYCYSQCLLILCIYRQWLLWIHEIKHCIATWNRTGNPLELVFGNGNTFNIN